ncbi:MAG: TatD family hydrolase [Candidatus Peregrinibacteria bacterium]
MIDTHCHLADQQFAADFPEVLRSASERGVAKMLCIGDSITESRKCLDLAEKYEQLYCTIGVHPHNAKEWKGADVGILKDIAGSSKKVRAIGEIGLDFHYDFSPRDKQKEIFAAQLELAQSLDLPVVIHCREAITEIKEALKDYPLHRAVLHCCSERWEDVSDLVSRGLFLSFTGIATFPKSLEIQQTIRKCPIEQLMVETDAPYLAPVPHRGKRNEPAYVVEVATFIAELKGMTFEDFERKTTENAVRFFGIV